ncbi:MAG: membrane protein insertase YidC [Clostridiales bacterium]|nr:membrane protein insertase YidC [Candidatus Coliplasma caballi]
MNILYVPFSYVMKGCLWITRNNYVFALFFFALVFQLVLLPLAIKSHKSQLKAASMRPKEMAIRKKYNGRTDRATQQKMQAEIQDMYQKEGYSPLSGCLPLLIQLPLIFILYAIVRYPIQYSSNFTDAAKAQIGAQYAETEVADLKDSEFQTKMEYYTFEYVEEIRASLKSGDAGNKANSELLALESKLNATVIKENEAEQKYENGFVKNELKLETLKKAAYAEMGACDVLQNYGENYVQSLKDSGALDAAFATSFPLSFEADGDTAYYNDMIPEFNFLSLNMLRTPSFSNNITWKDWILLLIPVLVFLTSWPMAKINKHFNPTPASVNGVEQPGGGFLLNVGMPLLSAVFSMMFPAAIGMYWVWRSLLSLGQPVLLYKLYPMPKLTEEDFKAAEQEYKGSQKKKKVITIEVDEDDDSYADIEVKSERVATAKPKTDGQPKKREDLPYRRPSSIEMLSADDDQTEDGKDE